MPLSALGTTRSNSTVLTAAAKVCINWLFFFSFCKICLTDYICRNLWGTFLHYNGTYRSPVWCTLVVCSHLTRNCYLCMHCTRFQKTTGYKTTFSPCIFFFSISLLINSGEHQLNLFCNTRKTVRPEYRPISMHILQHKTPQNY